MRKVGDYELHGSFASGGTATVHWGRLRGAGGFSRLVAIKQLHAPFARDPEMVTMLLDEARLASRVRHPNVVSMLDVVKDDEGQVLLVMEYVPGETLSRIAPGDGGVVDVAPAIASAILGGVLEGLHAAHEALARDGRPLELVHRDVSPQNILVGTDGLAHLLDFGIAKGIGREQVTRDGSIKGKLAYMSPEQLQSQPVSRATDVYAASVVLWELLAGRRLFDASSDADVVVSVLRGAVEPPSRYAPGLSPEIDGIVLRGLSRQRTARFPTGRSMAEALRRALPPASPGEVGEWLQSRASEVLRERGRAAVELEATLRHPQGVAAEAVGRATNRRRRAGLAMVALLVVVAAPAAWLLHARALVPMATAVPSASVESPPPPSPEPSASSAVETVAPLAPPSPAKPATTRSPGALPARSSPACDPPYTLQGHRKVFRPGCL